MTFARAAGLVSALALGLAVSSCRFRIDSVVVPLDDGGTGQPDLSLADLSGADLSTPDDLPALCSNSGPTSACSADGTMLLSCQGNVPVPAACEDGCSATPTPHCKHLEPSGAADPGDYTLAGLLAVSISGTGTINSETGEINAPPIVRGAGMGVDQGIGFRLAAQADGSTIGVFSFGTLTIVDNALLNVVGHRPIALVANGDIIVSGAIDVQGTCMPGTTVAGGGAGGAPKLGTGNSGGGMGAGQGGTNATGGGGGGGGGGHGDVGGKGATTSVTANAGGAGGVVFGDLTMDDPAISGGGGGAAGGGALATATGGQGGSGGGALQLVSNHQLTLASTAILQAGGCHGEPSLTSTGGGGGGGAGGAILLEARTIVVNNTAAIVANGGAGAGGGPGAAGGDGDQDASRAKGGLGGTKGTDGGDGGHTTSLFGQPGSAPNGSTLFGGGGGGSVGRIALKSKTGTVSTAGAVLSPIIGEFSAGQMPPATSTIAKFK